jgi:hypothetical protein
MEWKMQKILFFILVLMVTPNLVLSCDEDGVTGIVEENDLWIGPFEKENRNLLTEEDFNAVISRIEAIYAPIFNEYNKKLLIQRKWEDGTVNAYAKKEGTLAHVVIMGGLARHPEITPDSLALVVCHEAGHHIGGPPVKRGWGVLTSEVSWASNEGQADYFGALKCMRHYLSGGRNQEIMARREVPQVVKDECRSQFTYPEDRAICERTVLAGYSLANMFRALRMNRSFIPSLTFTEKDPSIVKNMFDNHPAPQCRFDTYYSAALCEKEVWDRISYSDLNKGVCSRSDGFIKGVRPLCWFKPPMN